MLHRGRVVVGYAKIILAVHHVTIMAEPMAWHATEFEMLKRNLLPLKPKRDWNSWAPVVLMALDIC